MADHRSYIYIDIETIGTVTPDEIAVSITPPANYKKPETIAAWEANDKPALIDEAMKKAALRGETGRIVCIGWAWDDEEATSFVGQDERQLLTDSLFHIHSNKPGNTYERPIIVGHNVAGFDIRFLWQRAFVLGVRLPAWFPRDPKPWSESIHDTMQMWSQRDFISLDNLCKAMGLPGKGNITGADVQRLWEEGRHDDIAAYCASDVGRVRSVHRKMLVSFGERNVA